MEPAEIGDQHRAPQRPQHVGALQEIRVVDRVAGGQVPQGHFHQHHRGFALQFRFGHKPFVGAFQHVERGMGERIETAALHQNRFFVEHLGPLHRLSFGGEHGRLGQVLLHQLQRHQAVVQPGKRRSVKADHVHFHAFPRQVVQQRTNQPVRIFAQIQRAV